MILYVDETENEEYFIVTGLLVESEKAINDTYYSFKKKLNDYKIASKLKGKLFTEFKSTLVDIKFQNVKRRMLEAIKTLNSPIIYSAYVKKTSHITQVLKEKVYIKLIDNIISSIDNNIDVIFDSFKMPIFERKIVKNVKKHVNVNVVIAGDSQLVPGLQFVDNLCSVLRNKLSQNDVYNFYSIIQDLVILSRIEQ